MILRNVLIVAAILIGSQAAYAQQLLAVNSFRGGQTVDKPGYYLSANQDDVKWKDTAYYYALKLRSCRYSLVSVTLTNTAADTLKYIDMSCSRLDIFTTDTKDARIFQDLKDCFKNSPTLFTLPPYASVTFKVPIYFFIANTGARRVLISKAFKIGMTLIKCNNNMLIPQDYTRIMRKDSEDIIWSNAVTVQ